MSSTPSSPSLITSLQSQVASGVLKLEQPHNLVAAAKRQIDPLTDAIRAQPHLVSVQLNGADFGEEAFCGLLDALKGKAYLSHLSLDDNRLTPQSAEKLAELLPTLPNLTSLRMNNMKLNGETLASVCRSLRHHPGLEYWFLSGNALGHDGVRQVCDTAQTIPTLAEFNLMNCDLDAGDIPVIASSVAQMPQIHFFHLPGNPKLLNASNMHLIADAFIAQDHLNITSLKDNNHEAPPLKRLLDRNKREAGKLHKLIDLHKDHLPLMPTVEVAQAYHRINAVYHLRNRNATKPAVQKFKIFLRHLPPLPAPEELSWESLTARREDGLAPLDNPANWQHFDKIADQLRAKGTPLTREQMESHNSCGETWVECGLASAPQQVVTAMNKVNLRISPAACFRRFGDDTVPSALLDAALASGRPASLMARANCVGASRSDIQRLYDALPATQQPKVALSSLMALSRDTLAQTTSPGR